MLTKNCCDLNLGESLHNYFFFSPDFGLYLLKGFDFYFDLFWMAWRWKPAVKEGLDGFNWQLTNDQLKNNWQLTKTQKFNWQLTFVARFSDNWQKASAMLFIWKSSKTTFYGWNNYYFNHLRCVPLRKSKIGFLNPKESENGFCFSLLTRSVQDHTDHGASKELKNLSWATILRV